MTRNNVRPMGYPACSVPSLKGMWTQNMQMSGMKQIPSRQMPTTMTAEERSLAMVYPKWQEFRDLYPLETALVKGTLFKELDKPFCY